MLLWLLAAPSPPDGDAALLLREQRPGEERPGDDLDPSSARLPHDMPRRRSRCDARLSSRCVRWYSCELAFCRWVGLFPCLESKHLRICNLWAETGGRASASR